MTADMEFTNEEWVDKTIPEDMPIRARLDEIKLNKRDWRDPKDPDPATGQPRVKEIVTLEWWWVVIDRTRGDGLFEGRRVKGECRPEMNSNPRNKMRNWSEALLGREIPVGMKLSLQELVGLEAEITISHKPDKNDPTMKWERVDEVIPVTMFGEEPPF